MRPSVILYHRYYAVISAHGARNIEKNHLPINTMHSSIHSNITGGAHAYDVKMQFEADIFLPPKETNNNNEHFT